MEVWYIVWHRPTNLDTVAWFIGCWGVVRALKGFNVAWIEPVTLLLYYPASRCKLCLKCKNLFAEVSDCGGHSSPRIFSDRSVTRVHHFRTRKSRRDTTWLSSVCIGSTWKYALGNGSRHFSAHGVLFLMWTIPAPRFSCPRPATLSPMGLVNRHYKITWWQNRFSVKNQWAQFPNWA